MWWEHLVLVLPGELVWRLCLQLRPSLARLPTLQQLCAPLPIYGEFPLPSYVSQPPHVA
jgi:hypothetical protein